MSAFVASNVYKFTFCKYPASVGVSISQTDYLRLGLFNGERHKLLFMHEGNNAIILPLKIEIPNGAFTWEMLHQFAWIRCELWNVTSFFEMENSRAYTN